MFSTLESNWDQSARRGWSALASFGFQALALSLLLAVPFFWVQGPPRLTWLQPLTEPVTSAPTRPAEEPVQRHYRAGSVSNILNDQLLQPRKIPLITALIDDSKSGPPAPDAPNIDFGTGRNGSNTVPWGGGSTIPAVMPKAPVPSHPMKVSHWAEGNLIHRVQPVYPAIARAAGIQGVVVLRAIVSKTGTIEHLTVVSGHPMLIKPAVEAVEQWRYRPYLLNDEPIEIDTEITVNFILSR